MHPADQGKTGAVSEEPILAANDDLGPAPPATPSPSAGASGWDPFEVWCTRVRDARRGSETPDAE
jgi:hypothetical protein